MITEEAGIGLRTARSGKILKLPLNTPQGLQDATIIKESLRTNLGEAQSLDLIEFVQRKAVVNAGRNDNKITRKNLNADPPICGILCVSESERGGIAVCR